MKSRRKSIFFFCAVLVLVVVMIISGLQIWKSAVSLSNQDESAQKSKTIVKEGKSYYPKNDLTVVMVLGIDQAGPVKSSDSYRNPGAADTIMLLLFDEKDETCSVLYLNRDTIMDVSVLGLHSRPAGTNREQLALAHTYGTGLKDSCENVRSTLENFLPGVTIDYYVSMNLDAIPILNDAVGGVKVHVTEDFSQVDPTIPTGDVVLRGNQVLSYVQTRKGVGDQKNVSRMERQKQYITGFLQQYKELHHGDPAFWLQQYEKIEPYIVTDCSSTVLSNMLSDYKDYSLKEVVTFEGENKIVDGYYEFHVDQQNLEETYMRLFYAKKK